MRPLVSTSGPGTRYPDVQRGFVPSEPLSGSRGLFGEDTGSLINLNPHRGPRTRTPTTVTRVSWCHPPARTVVYVSLASFGHTEGILRNTLPVKQHTRDYSGTTWSQCSSFRALRPRSRHGRTSVEVSLLFVPSLQRPPKTPRLFNVLPSPGLDARPAL